MGIETAPIIPANWDVRLDQNIHLLKHSFAVNDFGIWHHVSALDLNLGIDRTASFNHLVDTLHLDAKNKHAAEELKKINSDTVQAGQDLYHKFSNDVEQLKDAEPDKLQWEVFIDQAAEDAKQKAKQSIDKAAAAAKLVINKLPTEAEARQSAVDVFLAGYRAVARFFENVWLQIMEVAESVHQFLVGVWDKIMFAWSAISIAAEATLDWIRGQFGHEYERL